MISLGFRIPLVYISAFSWDGVAAHGMANRQQFFGRPDSGVLLCWDTSTCFNVPASSIRKGSPEFCIQQISMIHWHKCQDQRGQNVDDISITYGWHMDNKSCAKRQPASPSENHWFSCLTQPPMPATDGYSRHGRCGSDIPTVLVSTLTFLQRYPVLWLRHAEDVNSGDGETTLKQREEASKRELANLIDIKVGQLKFATGKELKMQFHASKGRLVYFPVGISSSLPTQQATNWNMWAYNELLWIETAGQFQIVSNQKEDGKNSCWPWQYTQTLVRKPWQAS